MNKAVDFNAILPMAETDVHTQRLLALAEWLDDGAPPALGVTRFNMHSFIAQSYDADNNLCGTACCIAGAAVMFYGSWTDVAAKVFADGPHKSTWATEAGKLLGLNEGNALRLFAPLYVESGPWDDITPAYAARVIRHYADTGTVDWAVCRGV